MWTLFLKEEYLFPAAIFLGIYQPGVEPLVKDGESSQNIQEQKVTEEPSSNTGSVTGGRDLTLSIAHLSWEKHQAFRILCASKLRERKKTPNNQTTGIADVGLSIPFLSLSPHILKTFAKELLIPLEIGVYFKAANAL